ncbi:MAG TPA: efflux RND transporter periplasmic adaptor subunit, partial [Clostridiales bacterium]|nr:efflux RND transporter periplasmic adaptor subunit [Clostridiales bacterium]
KKKKIQTGYQSNDYIEVISGLTGTEKIVFVGYDALIDGEKVIEKK